MLRLVVPVALAAMGSIGCETHDAGGPADSPDPRPWFVDQAQASGLEFAHINGRSGAFHQPELMGPGVGLLDYDNDGDLDVYLVQGGMLHRRAGRPDTTPSPAHGTLYRNDLQQGPDGRRLRFTEVTSDSGIDARGYGMGVATGDFTNDGCVDLYLTHFGPNQLFRNNCNGTFTDVSSRSGTDAPEWSVSASFVDFDRDGWLDLFVGNYLHYDVNDPISCHGVSGLPDYCQPERYPPAPDRLYRNRGDGTFADLTVDAGLAGTVGPALGATTADFDGDGWIDLFVANDQRENQLWLNQRNGTFRDVALASGTALSTAGVPNADMGVDAGDFDNDGDDDLLVTELTGQGSMLYVNDGHGWFEERSAATGLRRASLPYTGFGTAWIDYDNDGWLDVLSVNGLVTQNLDALGPDNPFPLQQRNLLLRNLGGTVFDDVSGDAGPIFERSEVSRGAAFGDVDNDGDLDVVVANDDGPARLLVNQIGTDHHWLGLRFVGATTSRDMLGTRVAVIRPDTPTLWRRARADGSYASANDPRVLVGLGAATSRPRVHVLWPSGHVDEWDDLPIDRYHTLTEGAGK